MKIVAMHEGKGTEYISAKVVSHAPHLCKVVTVKGNSYVVETKKIIFFKPTQTPKK